MGNVRGCNVKVDVAFFKPSGKWNFTDTVDLGSGEGQARGYELDWRRLKIRLFALERSPAGFAVCIDDEAIGYPMMIVLGEGLEKGAAP